MSGDLPGTVSRLLEGVHQGDDAARGRLAQLMEVELRRLAESVLRKERVGHTLQPADLVQEVFLRLLEGDVLEKAPNRAYLFGAASTALRRVLVNYARKRGAARRGGGQNRVPLLDDALEGLQALHARQCQIVDEYHFGGYTLREIAEHLGVSEATVSVDLKRAQLWKAMEHLEAALKRTPDNGTYGKILADATQALNELPMDRK